MTVEPSVDHPFFVLNYGWSSCSPQATLEKYNLTVRQLQVGDQCVSLTKTTEKPAQKSIPNISMPPPQSAATTNAESHTSNPPQSASSLCSSANAGDTIASTSQSNSIERVTSPIINVDEVNSPITSKTLSTALRLSPSSERDQELRTESPIHSKTSSSSCPRRNASVDPSSVASTPKCNTLPIDLSKAPDSPTKSKDNNRNASPVARKSLKVDLTSTSSHTQVATTKESLSGSSQQRNSPPAITRAESVSPKHQSSPKHSPGRGKQDKAMSPLAIISTIEGKSSQIGPQSSPTVTTTASSSSRVSPSNALWRPGVSTKENVDP